MKLPDMCAEVFRNLVRRKLRTALTVLGITIGCLTVSLIVALGFGLQSFIHMQVKSLADPRVIQVLGAKDLPITQILSTVFTRLGHTPKEVDESGFNPGAFNLRYLNQEEVKALRTLPHVESVSPATIVFTNYIQLAGDKRKFEVVVIAEGEGFRMKIGHGRGFNNDGTRQVVLAHHYLEAFGIEEPEKLVGKTVRFGLSQLPLTIKKVAIRSLWKGEKEKVFEAKVIGLAEKSLLSMAAYVNLDFAIELARHFLDDPELHTPDKFGFMANITVDSAENVPLVREAIKEMHLTPLTLQERIGFLDSVFVVLQSGLAVFGLVALVVAGLGIANTLLMATYERKREIGLMKALGMSNAGIRTIFALEAVIMGLIGGVAGIVGAYLIGIIGNLIATTTFASAWEGLDFFVFPWWLSGGIMLFSAIVGLIAGIYPAMKASHLDPILALRSE
jgi:putative ABC transport system permease protein